MPGATRNGALLAEASDDAVEIVEGNVYFPPQAVDRGYLRDSRTETHYASPKDAAANIAGHIAFWKGVTVE